MAKTRDAGDFLLVALYLLAVAFFIAMTRASWIRSHRPEPPRYIDRD